MTFSKLMACFFLLPGLLLFALAGKVACHSFIVQWTWARVDARVVDASQKVVTLEFSMAGTLMQRDALCANGFAHLSPGTIVAAYVPPSKEGKIRRATVGELWQGVIVTTLFALLFAGAGGAALWMESSPRFAPPTTAVLAAQQMEDMRKFIASAQAEAGEFEAADAVASPNDHSDIVIREPSQSWKANVFWGLLFGLLLAVPPLFAGEQIPGWKKVGMMALGLGWMAFMARSAIQNKGRSIRCDLETIDVREPLGGRQIPIANIRKIVRSDVRRNLRELEDIGRSSRQMRGLDTRAEMIVYSLYDANGKELLRLDKDMQPENEMRRLLDRLEEKTGVKIVGE